MTVSSIPVGDIDKAEEGSDAYEYLKDSMGRFRTQSLFWEMRQPKYPAPFTLKDKDHQGRISMYRKYMEIGDPTEYRTAIALLGHWRHWEALCSSKWFSEYINRWRGELAVKLESDRFSNMLEIEKNQKGSPAGTQATKWLADRYSTTPKKTKRGRPTKAEKLQALKNETEEEQLLVEEAERLGLE